MLMVKASAKQSPIEGLGLFANEDIPKGTVIWKYNPRFDISFTPEEVESMSAAEKKLIDTYAFLSPQQGKYIYSIDDSRFTNHSSIHANESVLPSPGDVESSTVANRDIKAGEEILSNYRLFDTYEATSDEEYLSH